MEHLQEKYDNIRIIHTDKVMSRDKIKDIVLRIMVPRLS